MRKSSEAVMKKSKLFISDLVSTAPRFSASQEELLSFLSAAHSESAMLQPGQAPVDRQVAAYGVRPSQIASRSFECNDVFEKPGARTLYTVRKGAESGALIEERAHFFSVRAREIFEELYSGRSEPAQIVHVTCTGYISPSAPQRLVADRGWNTGVTHAYHMGCYASLPAVRLAAGLVASEGGAVDIVHTEMCSLHMNPAVHTPEQLVVQSLFADGHIRYTVGEDQNSPGFRILSVKEKILPGTQDLMGWMPASWGMQMNLSREVPDKIRENIRPFVSELLREAGIPLEVAMRTGIFAIHPGGPKIVESVRTSLELSEEQVKQSKRVLRERGNMSSATIPHVWQEILRDGAPAGTPIVSLAFGPGLTVFGSVMELCP
jgi:predicted naringenin-chalcone synthase